MTAAVDRARLYDALAALPEGVTGEIVGGQLYAYPRPSASHAVAAAHLGADLIQSFARGRGGLAGWWILIAPELHFVRDREILVPDLAGWRRDRMPRLPEDQRFEVVPDWVCEVLSPSTASYDREVKLPVYARFGVTYAWLLDPRARTLEVLVCQAGVWSRRSMFGAGDTVSAPPFEAIGISADALWPQ